MWSAFGLFRKSAIMNWHLVRSWNKSLIFSSKTNLCWADTSIKRNFPFIFVTQHVTLNGLTTTCISLERKKCLRYMYHFLFHTCIGLPHEMLIFGDILINMKTENRTKKNNLNPFAPEPPLTARADPLRFYRLWRHQF